MKNILIWSNDLNLAKKIAVQFENENSVIHTVCGRECLIPENIQKIDLLILVPNAKAENDGVIGTGHNYDDIMQVIDLNVNGARNCFEESIHLLRNGDGKRVMLVTNKSSSLESSKETDNYAYNMSLTAVNKLLCCWFNIYHPEGFTFRCFACDVENDKKYGISIKDYAELDFFDPKGGVLNSDEDRMVMRDNYFTQIAW